MNHLSDDEIDLFWALVRRLALGCLAVIGIVGVVIGYGIAQVLR